MKELAETTASICSTDDCMMFKLARAFNSAKVSGSTLPRRTLSDTSTINCRCETDPEAVFWTVDATDCEDK